MVTLQIPDRVCRLVPPLAIALFAFSPVVAWMPPLAFNRPAASDRIAPIFPGLSEQDLFILDRVDQQRVTLNLENVPLQKALHSLQKESGIQIAVDEAQLTENGIDVNALVTLKVQDELVRDVLSKLVEPQWLDWIVDDGKLSLYSLENYCGGKTPAGIYPVADLVDDGEENWKELESAIRDNSSGMWDEVDGEGGRMGRVTAARSLIISQTYKAHAEIDRFLTALRAAKRIGREAMAPKAALADEPLFVPASSHGRPTP
ncbi:hypothetical protein [Planctellipticum variicoloris]|uniref:hypothetical protein n=1 Tax=Planctellipticum variicoloris TaxID=3064265 RepID=UPI003013A118|nr:hypothetical protein SH412_003392 [Planctomycetaceae bacterium SH412]